MSQMENTDKFRDIELVTRQTVRDLRLLERLLFEAAVLPEERKRICQKIYDKRITEVKRILEDDYPHMKSFKKIVQE